MSKEQACSTRVSFRFFAVFVLFEREAGRLWENWLVTKTAFPPLDATSLTDLSEPDEV